MTSLLASGPDVRPPRIPRRSPPTPGEEALGRIGDCLQLAFQPAGAGARPVRPHLPRIVASSKRHRHLTDACSPRVTTITPSEADIRTEISFQPEVPVMERRIDDRSKISVYRSAMLRWGGYEALCLIRNISPGGLMGKLHTSLPPDEPVTVEIRSGSAISGRIAWSADGMIGVQFDERIDVLEVLHAPVQGEPEAHPAHAAAAHHLPGEPGGRGHAGRASRWSTCRRGGVKVEADFLREGDAVTVGVHGLEPRRGVVRWAHDGRAGIGSSSRSPSTRSPDGRSTARAELAGADA